MAGCEEGLKEMRLHRPIGIASLAFALQLAAMQAGLAWGPQGHRIVALLAGHLLQQSDPAVHAKMLALLAGDRSDRSRRRTKIDLAGEATWLDTLIEKSPEARDAMAAWNATRLKPDHPDIAAACFGHTPLPAGYPASHGPRENCSLDKVAQFERELKNPGSSPSARATAVRFLLSLVPDLNDPLLAIDEGDQGGFCVALQVEAKPPVRLATYWDETLVAVAAGHNAARGAAALATAIGTAERSGWAQGGPQAWLQDSFEVAKTVTYSFMAEQPAGKHTFAAAPGEPCPTVNLYRVGPDYERKALAAVRTQLAKAGVRLAAVLRDSLK
ncbi:MAG: S1/P1 nuclease [Thiohalocapsa sp.]